MNAKTLLPPIISGLLGGLVALSFGHYAFNKPEAEQRDLWDKVSITKVTEDDGQDLRRRIEALEEALDQSFQLQTELSNQVSSLQQQLGDEGVELAGTNNYQVRNRPVPRAPFRSPEEARRNHEQARKDRLLEYGFDSETLANIEKLEAQAEMDRLELRYSAGTADYQSRMAEFSSKDPIREELGDEAYDRYLYASGRANRVRVSDVIPTSPGEKAGLKRGDVVLSYDGTRVFKMADIINLSKQGSQGESVAVQVRRSDGSQASIYLPRGPIGIRGRGSTREDPGKGD